MTLADLEKLGAFADGEGRIRAEALIDGASQGGSDSMPWVGRLALGVGAWLAGLFMVGFVWLVIDMMRLGEQGPMGVIGSFMVAGSVCLLRFARGVFLEQLGLAVGLAGHALFFVSLNELVPENDFAGPWFGAVLIAGPVYYFSRNAIQRFLSVGWVWITWWLASFDFWSGDAGGVIILGLMLASLAVVITMFWGIEKLSQPLWRPIGWASLIAVLGSAYWVANLPEWDRKFDLDVERVFGVVAALSLGGLLWQQIRAEGKECLGLIVWVALLVGLGIAGAAGVVVSLGLLAVSHARRDRRLTGLSFLSLALFLVVFYYHLGLPFLEKSITLMVAGICILAFRAWLGRMCPVRHEPEEKGGAR